MANEYFDNSELGQRFVEGETARGSDVDNKLDSVEAGFDKLPTETQLKEGRVTLGIDTGTANNYLIAMPYAPTAYSAGMTLRFKVVNANTGPSTVNVDSLGAKTIKRPDGTALKSGDLSAAATVTLTYDGVNFRLDSPSMNSVADAEASAASAANSASAAVTSESNAASSASASASSASAAGSSETNAAASAASASSSASSAATSAASASSSANAASSSAANASTSATAADTSKSNAAISANAAAASASNAASSETVASASEINAAASEINAAASETAAAGSATAAANSAASINKVPYSARNCVLNQAAVSQDDSTRVGQSSTLFTGAPDLIVNTGVDMTSQWGVAGEQFGGLTWIKSRTGTTGHYLFDTVRGGDNRLRSDSTLDEAAVDGVAFLNNGISLGTETGINSTGVAHVVWSFQTSHRTKGVTNRNKPYTCHYNPQTGFSMVGYEADGIAGHELPYHLPIPPELSIYKNEASGYNWLVKIPEWDGTLNAILLNTTGALTTNTGSDCVTTDSVISLGSSGHLNASGAQYMSYHFASVPGVSKVGQYIGTGLPGNYVDCDFGDDTAGWLLIKNLTTGTTQWVLIDAVRTDKYLLGGVDAETSGTPVEFVPGGFVATSTGSWYNTLDNKYLFLAFAKTSSDGTKAWAEYSYPVAPDTVSIKENSLISYAGGFDALGPVDYVEQVGAGATFKTRSNQLTNGSFDTDATGWNVANNATVTVDANGVTVTNTEANGYIYQSFAAEVGRNYVLQFDITDDVGPVGARVRVGESTSGTEMYTNTTALPVGYYNIEFTATSSTVFVRLGCHGGTAGESMTFDNVSVLEADQLSRPVYLYKDRNGSYGTTEHRPLIGTSRDSADEWGVESPLDPSLRTTAKHSGYESSTGVVSASGETSTNYAWKAFNKDPNNMLTSSFWTVGSQVSQLQYKLTEKRILKSWRLREYNAITETPQRFTIEGSNDGLNWVVIDGSYSTANYTGNGAYLWGDLQDTSYNTTPYLYHRINVTQTSSGTVTALAELEFNTVLPSDYYNISEGVMYESATEKQTNGGFDTDTVWTKGDGWSISGGEAHSDGSQTNTSTLGYDMALTVGDSYLIEWEVTAYTSGSIRGRCGGVNGALLNGLGVKQQIIVAGAGANTGVNCSADFVGSIDNIRVIPINHLEHTATERVYLAKLILDAGGGISSIENFPISKGMLQDTEVHGDLKVRGGIESDQVLRAWVSFDGTQSPALIKSSYNVDDIVRTSAGIYKIIFSEPQPDRDYLALGSGGNEGLSAGDLSRGLSTEKECTVVVYNSAGAAVDREHTDIIFIGRAK